MPPGEDTTITRIGGVGRNGLLGLVAALLMAAVVVFGPTVAPAPAQAQSGTVAAPLQTPYEVLGSYPHDPGAFL